MSYLMCSGCNTGEGGTAQHQAADGGRKTSTSVNRAEITIQLNDSVGSVAGYFSLSDNGWKLVPKPSEVFTDHW